MTVGVTLLVTAAALLGLEAATFAVALRVGRHSVADTAWGVGIALAALVSLLARFKAGPGSQGLIMDRGLWRYTRHPNYFGDFCMWWGVFLIALGSWAELPTVIAPLLMTYILTRGTGQRLTDQRMVATRPQYADYAARTSSFIPLPPRGR